MEEKNRVRLLRERTGLNRKEFSERFEIPYRTVTDWELGNRHAPEYVIRLLEYYVRLAEPGLCGRPVEESVKEHYITTYTGQRFYPTNPQAEAVHVEDIAHALSLITRGNGHVRTFWSVGEHCLCCAKEAKARGLSTRVVLACLLHDAGECYLSDIPRPFKAELPGYRASEARLISMIYEKFLGSDLSEEEARLVDEIDDAMLWSDMWNLFGIREWEERPETLTTPDYTVRAFAEVEREYLEMFRRESLEL